MTSARVDCSAGARPNNVPHSSETTKVTSRTRQFISALIVKWSSPFASSSVRARTPQTASSTPSEAAERGEQHAFGQQLPNDPEAPGADAEPHRHLAPPGRGSREQQVRRVGARQQQDQPDEQHQEQEGLRVVPAKIVQAARTIHQMQHGKIRPLRWRGCRRRDPLLKQRRERRLRFLAAHARPEPRHDLDPVVALRRGTDPA